MANHGVELEFDEFWKKSCADADAYLELDPKLRRVVGLVRNQDWKKLESCTGITCGADPKSSPPPELTLLLQLARNADGTLVAPRAELGLCIPKAYFDQPDTSFVTARLVLDNALYEGNEAELRARLVKLVTEKKSILRMSLASPLQPALRRSLRAIAMPSDQRERPTPLDGRGVIVGIIDDGCALAHQDFLAPTADGGLKSRILYLWDQSATAKPSFAGWKTPDDFGYGSELDQAAMNAALAASGGVRGCGTGANRCVVDARKVYDYLDYRPSSPTSHGTHVMSIAAGNGRSLMGTAGVASAADIVFVQLPRSAIETGGRALDASILDGVKYVFERARREGKPAVVNISYGGYCGPHDGTTELEMAIDEMLKAAPDATKKEPIPPRSVVVAAGNGYDKSCHASGKVDPGVTSGPLCWNVYPQDPTSNYLEIWYSGNARFALLLTPPRVTEPLAPVRLGDQVHLMSDGKLVGTIDHVKYAGNSDVRISIALSAAGPATSGRWTIELKNEGAAPADFDLWIERDVQGRRASVRRQQSVLDPKNVDPRCTLGSLATGRHTIVVGAYNAETELLSEYSACGPTRAIGGDASTARRKPEVCAPAEADAAGRGILCASALLAQPTRMNGTSAAAPHVAGLVALMYQRMRELGCTDLSANEIRDLIRDGAQNAGQQRQTGPQRPGRVLERPRQSRGVANRDERRGAGEVNIQATLNRLETYCGTRLSGSAGPTSSRRSEENR